MIKIKINGTLISFKRIKDIEFEAQIIVEELKAQYPNEPNYATPDMFRAIYLGKLSAHYEILERNLKIYGEAIPTLEEKAKIIIDKF